MSSPTSPASSPNEKPPPLDEASSIPTLPSLPSTPPSAVPGVRVTLPTPPSFAAHRATFTPPSITSSIIRTGDGSPASTSSALSSARLAQVVEHDYDQDDDQINHTATATATAGGQDGSPKSKKKGHGRSVSFSADLTLDLELRNAPTPVVDRRSSEGTASVALGSSGGSSENGDTSSGQGESEELVSPPVDRASAELESQSNGSGRSVYKIPQRQSDRSNEIWLNSAKSLASPLSLSHSHSLGSASPSPSLNTPGSAGSLARFRRAPPLALSLKHSTLKSPLATRSLLSQPQAGVPKTAPLPGLLRLSGMAASKGVSIAPSSTPSSSFPSRTSTQIPKTAGLTSATSLGSARKALNRHSFSLADKASIWSASGPGTAMNAGWTTPALGSARSVKSPGLGSSTTGTARQRGLTVAVLKEGEEGGTKMLVDAGPVTPGLPMMSGRAPVTSTRASEENATRSADSEAFLKAEKEGNGVTAEKELGETTAKGSEQNDGEIKSPPPSAKVDPKRREIILCRFYHTPGLTCTSRPCRFIHNLDSILPALKSPSASSVTGSSASPALTIGSGSGSGSAKNTDEVVKYRMLSSVPRTTSSINPRNGDFTSGTFAQAQQDAQADAQAKAKAGRRRSLNLQSLTGSNTINGDGNTSGGDAGKGIAGFAGFDNYEIDVSEVVSGEMVVVAGSGQGGEDLVGTVFLMSGGGKGPAGKSKEKFKTVLCKDYAQGHCPYGDFCSFIHDEKASETPSHPADGSKDSKAKEVISPDCATKILPVPELRPRPKSTTNAWFKDKPKFFEQQTISVDQSALERQRNELSAFAPPFKATPAIDSAEAAQSNSDERANLTDKVLSPRPSNVPTDQEAPTVPGNDAGPGEGEVKKPKVSAWSKGPPKSLAPIKIIEPIPEVRFNDTENAPECDNHNQNVNQLQPPPVSAAYSIYTESDPATPWDPAIRRQKSMDLKQSRSHSNLSDILDELDYATGLDSASLDSHMQYQQYNFDTASQSQASISEVPSSAHAMYPSLPMEFYAPTYPWGIPMSPVSQLMPGSVTGTGVGGGAGQKSKMRAVDSTGVLWTPAGWAVQDAAMKQALGRAEAKSQGLDVKIRPGKHYYRKRPCKFFAEGHCPHGDECSYLHILPTDLAILPTQPPRKITPRLPCKFFNSSSGCHNGTSCSFLHTLVVPDSAPLIDKPRAWRTRPCRHFQLDRCTLGDTCGFAHVVDPAFAPLEHEVSQGDRDGSGVECYEYTREGRCRRGVACRFRHLAASGENRGVGAGMEDHSTTEDRLRALREISLKLGEDGEEDEDDDDVEIVTASASPSSPERSVAIEA